MTRPQQPAPDDIQEAVAEALWREDLRRAAGRERSISWSEADPHSHKRFRGFAATIHALYAPLIAEAVERAEKAAIVQVAKAAHVIGWQAGVGGMETAGAIVSYLANHQDQIKPFFADEEGPLDWADFVEGGCLTWHAQKGGKIVHPDAIRSSASERAA